MRICAIESTKTPTTKKKKTKKNKKNNERKKKNGNKGMEFDVEDLRYLVIDEADQLLQNKNFIKSLKQIFALLPQKNRQSLLFSATLDQSMKHIYSLSLSHGNCYYTH